MPDIAWGARENGDPSDLDSPLVPIPAGDLDAVRSCTDRVYKQWTGVQDWTDLMSIIGETFDELDDVLGEVDVGRYIGSAIGVQLEEIGAMVGRPRGSLVDDEDYRTAIRVDAATVFFQGSHPELLSIVRSIEPDARIVTYLTFAQFSIVICDMTQDRHDLILDLLADVPPAGVQGLLVSCSSDNYGWDHTTALGNYVGGFEHTTPDGYSWGLFSSVAGI